VVSLIFVDHAQDRQDERGVTDAQAEDCVCTGRSIRYEPPTKPTKSVQMRCNFEKKLKAHTIMVVVTVSDSDPNLFVVTVTKTKN